jgi:NAD-dependent deacetylase
MADYSFLPDRISRVVVLSGAGISAESSVPTFRGEDGLWRNYRAEQLATPEAWRANPELVWEWYAWRRGLIAGCEPNPAHHACAKLEKELADSWIVTQNVDGLHRRAGAKKIVEIHGSIWKIRTMDFGEERFDWDPDTGSTQEKIPWSEGEPRRMMRPGVVWFGESLPEEGLEKAVELCSTADLCIVVGTSGIVYPAAGFPEISRRSGVPVVDINVAPTNISNYADAFLQGPAGEMLPPLVDEIIARKG